MARKGDSAAPTMEALLKLRHNQGPANKVNIWSHLLLSLVWSHCLTKIV